MKKGSLFARCLVATPQYTTLPRECTVEVEIVNDTPFDATVSAIRTHALQTRCESRIFWCSHPVEHLTVKPGATLFMQQKACLYEPCTCPTHVGRATPCEIGAQVCFADGRVVNAVPAHVRLVFLPEAQGVN